MKYFPEKLSDALEALLHGCWSIIDLRNESDDKLAKVIPAKGLRNGIRRNLQEFIDRKRNSRPLLSSSAASARHSYHGSPILIDDSCTVEVEDEEFEIAYSG